MKVKVLWYVEKTSMDAKIDSILLLSSPPLRGVGRPPLSMRQFTEGEKLFLDSLTIEDLIRVNKKLSDKFYTELNRRLKKFIDNELIKGFFIQSVLLPLVHDKILRALRASRRSPLKGLSNFQVEMLLAAYSLTSLKKGGIFQAKNFFNLGQYQTDITNNLKYFAEIGYVEEIDDTKLYKLTKKVRSNKGKRAAIYIMTRAGKIVLKDYFAAYEKLHKDFTNNLFIDDLHTINTNLKTGYKGEI